MRGECCLHCTCDSVHRRPRGSPTLTSRGSRSWTGPTRHQMWWHVVLETTRWDRCCLISWSNWSCVRSLSRGKHSQSHHNCTCLLTFVLMHLWAWFLRIWMHLNLPNYYYCYYTIKIVTICVVISYNICCNIHSYKLFNLCGKLVYTAVWAE